MGCLGIWLFVFCVKSNCFHHTKLAVIYGICWLLAYHECAKLERDRCATFPTYKFDLACLQITWGVYGISWSPVFTLEYWIYDFSTFSVILCRSLTRVNSPNITKYIRAMWTFSFWWHHLQYRHVYTATYSCTHQ